MSYRFWLTPVVLVLSLMLAACVSTSSTTTEHRTPSQPATTTDFHGDPDDEAGFPASEAWAAENPQPADGIQLDLAISAFFGDGFEGESIEVRLDGELIVAGTALPPEDPDEHTCPAGPYSVILNPGIHEIEAVTGSGESVSESFDLTELAMGNIFYTHPSSDPGEMDEPVISWELYGGQAYVCA